MKPVYCLSVFCLHIADLRRPVCGGGSTDNLDPPRARSGDPYLMGLPVFVSTLPTRRMWAPTTCATKWS